jgi:hypothetical protein
MLLELRPGTRALLCDSSSRAKSAGAPPFDRVQGFDLPLVESPISV